MAPAAGVVDEESSSPQEEEYATPPSKSSADQAPGPDQSENTNADSDVAPDNLADHTAASGTNRSKDPSPQETNGDMIAVDTSHVDTKLTAPAAPSTSEVFTRSPLSSTPNHDGSSAALNFPIVSAAASSLPHNRLHTSQSRGPASSPAPTTSAPSITLKLLKVEKEVARLKAVIEKASPEALHKLFRQEWRVFLYSPLDEDHLSYVLRVTLKNSTPIVVERGIKEILARPDFRPIVLKHALNTDASQLIEALPEEIRNGMVNSLLQMVTADQAIDCIPKDVKDEIVAHHIRETPAKVLVNWLAKANRLGYSTEDVIDSDDELVSPPDLPGLYGARASGIEDVTMSETPYQQLPPQARSHLPAIGDPLLLEQDKIAEIQREKPYDACILCGFSAPTWGGQAYHTHKKPCRKSTLPDGSGWSARCLNCGVIFVTRQGQNYHNLNKVCSSGKYSDDAPIPAPASAPVRPTFTTAPRAPPPHSPHLVSAQTYTATEKQIPRPPLRTPAPILPPTRPHTTHRQPELTGQEAIQAIDPKARVNPSQLSPAKKAEMEAKIDAENQRYQDALAALENDPNLSHLTEKEKGERRISLKNSNATKKSQIRKRYGVSLRLREKDKIALRSAPLSSPTPALTATASKAAPSYSSPYVPSHVSTPSGFSPINGPSPPNSNGFGRLPMPPRPQSSSLPQNGSQVPDSRMSGFGVLKVQSTAAHRAKRQRTSSFGEQAKSPAIADRIPPLSRTQTPYGPASTSAGASLSMIEVSSEDAASKYPKKVPVRAAQAKWEALRGRKNGMNGSVETLTRTSAGGAASAPNARQEPIEIDSSSDTDEPEPLDNGAKAKATIIAARLAANEHLLSLHDADKPVPTTEYTESEGSRPTSSGTGVRGKFTAKRGGRHSLNR